MTSELADDAETVRDLVRMVNDLQDEVQDLQERVAELESSGAETSVDSISDNSELDRYDEKVIQSLQEGKRYTPRQIVTMYKRKTSIRQTDTAKRRAKDLTSREFMQPDSGGYIYRGGDRDE